MDRQLRSASEAERSKEDWSFCYCPECHLDSETDEKLKDRADRRQMAKEMVLQGAMQGYLAYDDGMVIGWCNCDDKVNYRLLTEDEQFFTEDTQNGFIL